MFATDLIFGNIPEIQWKMPLSFGRHPGTTLLESNKGQQGYSSQCEKSVWRIMMKCELECLFFTLGAVT